MEADEALKLLGAYSRWQMMVYMAYAIGFGVMFSWMAFSIVFIVDTPGYRCALPPNTTLNDTIPFEVKEGELQYSKCEMFVNKTESNQTTPCMHGYWYDPASGYESTLVSEWDLVCGKNWLVEASMTVGGIGKTVGLLIFPRLADLIGRKPIFLGCLWTNVLVGIAQAFSPSMLAYTVFAFFDGFQQQGMISSAAVLAMELFPTDQRTFAGVAIEFFWVFGVLTLTPFAYFLRNWRKLLLAVTLPLVTTLSYYWLIPESIPWMVANGKIEKANRVMKYAAKFNKVTLPETVFEQSVALLCESKEGVNGEPCTDRASNKKSTTWDMVASLWRKPSQEEDTGKHNKYGVLDIFRNASMRKYALAMVYVWFVNSLVYGSMVMTVTFMEGDRYLNYFLYGLVEVPAYIITYIALEKIGRIKPLFVFHVIAGVALTATVIQTFEFGKNLQPLVITLNLIGKFAISGSFAVIFCNTSEIFPTNIRNTGFGMCNFAARLSGYIGPYFRILARSSPWLSQLILGLLAFTAGIATLLLPETRYCPLPDTMEDVEAWDQQKKQKRNKPSDTQENNKMDEQKLTETLDNCVSSV